MKKKVIIILICIAFAASTFAGCGAKEVSITIQNDTAWTFHEMSISPSDAEEWGADKLNSPLQERGSVQVSLDASSKGLYDMQATDEEGVYWSFVNIPIENKDTVTLYETETDIIAEVSSGTEIIGELSWPEDGDVTDEPATAEGEAPSAPGFGNVTPEMIEGQIRSNNGSLIAVYGEWRYGTVFGRDNHYYFVREKADDGSGGTVIDDRGFVADIAVLDDATMFYILESTSAEQSGLYMCTADGQNGVQLAAGNIFTMQLCDGKLYFSGEGTENKLMCYDPASGATAIILDQAVFFPYVYGDKILYQFDADEETLHICDMDGSNDNRVTDSVSHSPIFDGEYIYYINAADSRALYRVLPDGSGKQKLSAIPARAPVLAGGMLYFGGTEDGKVYRMNQDGSDAQIISDAISLQTATLTILGETLYFVQGDFEGIYYYDTTTGAIGAALATPDPTPAPTPKPASNEGRGDYVEEDGWGDYVEEDGWGDYVEEDGWGDIFE